jgi:hypothetical protein
MGLRAAWQNGGAGQSNGGSGPMAWAASYVPDKATVVVNGSGRLGFEDMKRIAMGATDLLHENKASRLLRGFSGCEGGRRLLLAGVLQQGWCTAERQNRAGHAQEAAVIGDI